MGENAPRCSGKWETLVLPFTPIALSSSGLVLKPSLSVNIGPEMTPGHSMTLLCLIPHNRMECSILYSAETGDLRMITSWESRKRPNWASWQHKASLVFVSPLQQLKFSIHPWTKVPLMGVVESSTIYQEESHPRMHWVIGRHTSVPAAEPAGECDLVPAPLDHGLGEHGHG